MGVAVTVLLHLGAAADVVIGALPCAVVATESDGITVAAWNPAAERLFGWTAAEVIGRAAPHRLAGFESELTDLLEQHLAGRPTSITTQRRRKDGTVCDVLLESTPIFAPDGRYAGSLCTLQDITQLRVTSRELGERQRLTEQLVEAIRELSAELDVPAVLDGICQRAVGLVGAHCTGFAVLDDSQFRFVACVNGPPGVLGLSWPVSEGITAAAVRTQQPVVIQDLHMPPDPSHAMQSLLPDVHTLVCVPAVRQGAVVGELIVAFTEVGRPVADHELEVLLLFAAHAAAVYSNAMEHAEVVRSRARQRAIVDATADGMALVGPDGLVRSWNTAAESLTGVPAHKAIGAPPPFPLGEVGSVVDHQQPSGRWLEIITSRVADTDETVIDFRDVTQTKRLEEARELFLATASHELRTPITVVKGFAGTLLHRWHDLTDAERRGAVTTIVQRTEALAGLVDQLLTGATGPAAVEVDDAPFDLVEAVRESLAGLVSLSPAHPLAFDAAPDVPLVKGDRASIDNIVGQLVENAIKYSPDGGQICVSVAAAAGFVAVRVSDEGIGLDPDDAELIFERFYQAPGGHRRRLGGVGLGLYIVRRLVEAQGGAVRAYGSLGAGTTVEFALPTATGAAVSASGGQDQQTPDG